MLLYFFLVAMYRQHTNASPIFLVLPIVHVVFPMQFLHDPIPPHLSHRDVHAAAVSLPILYAVAIYSPVQNISYDYIFVRDSLQLVAYHIYHDHC